jgi:hypothetical protein
MARDWSRAEVAAAVDDYFEMLILELAGKRYSKAQHYRALIPRLDGRTKGAIEKKHENISAILRDLDHPWIFGCKPYGNYQRLLFEVVDRRVNSDKSLADRIQALIAQPATVPEVPDPLNRRETPPNGSEQLPNERPIVRPHQRRHTDYFAREARNASLGLAGEEFVLRVEQARLAQIGRADLAKRVQHVSVEEGDDLGFDIRSFEPDERDRLIEVKTTTFARATPFFVSRNQVKVSRLRAEVFHLYRVFQFRTDVHFYVLSGALESTCRLDPVQFEARVK